MCKGETALFLLFQLLASKLLEVVSMFYFPISKLSDVWISRQDLLPGADVAWGTVPLRDIRPGTALHPLEVLLELIWRLLARRAPNIHAHCPMIGNLSSLKTPTWIGHRSLPGLSGAMQAVSW